MTGMRTPFVIGNWKMNLTQAEAASLVEQVRTEADHLFGVEVGVCPTFVSLGRVAMELNGSTVRLGAQDVFWKDAGAFTGCVSARMLRDVHVDLCVVGHSERRGRFGKLEIEAEDVPFFAETDRTVNQKIRALLPFGITPVLCVGETLAERESGATESVIEGQLRGALAGLDAAEVGEIVIAYEPVWAIGTGQTCDAVEANRVCGVIRAVVRALAGDEADRVRVLYGGSVKAENAKELFGQPEIDGGLVGGASLDAKGFGQIVKAAL